MTCRGKAIQRGLACILGVTSAVACGPALDPSVAGDAGTQVPGLYANAVVRFVPGDLAGYGQERFPDVVLGPPHGGGLMAPNTDDVMSLGLGGVIELAFPVDIIDGDGPDFLVFENPFMCGSGRVYAEPAEVAVSLDGEHWVAFPCAWAGSTNPCVPEEESTCAGYRPVLADPSNPDNPLSANNPWEAGGDPFDLADIGLARARFVRITDRNIPGGLQAEPTAGFDLDAVAVVHGDTLIR